VIKHLFRRKNGAYYYRIVYGDIREEKSAHTKDKEVATKKLNDRYRQIEREAEGLAIPAKIKQANQLPLDKHLDLYLTQKDKEWTSENYYNHVRFRLRKLFRECKWSRISDIRKIGFLEWRSQHATSVKTLNDYLSTLKGFVRWLNEWDLTDTNEIASIPPIKSLGRKTFERRALSREEMKRLLSTVDNDMRAAVYVTAIFTGLRRNELRLLQWGDVHLNEKNPYLAVRASTTKNKKKVNIPLIPHVADALRKIRPESPKGDDSVFDVPEMDVYKADLSRAEIPFEDDQKRRLDFHALRKTLGTYLAVIGVPLQVAKEIMRHSDIKLTLGSYTDAGMLPTGEAMDSLSDYITQSSTSNSTSKTTKRDFSGGNLTQTVGVSNPTLPYHYEALRPCKSCRVPAGEMVEVGGIEPPSAQASQQLLRV